ncbi:MAG TPA: STAS domain-containing protein [Gemmataceae bacterium]|nr:STAS domain-containing protein [Gemmataceae bacterium]
MRLFLTSEDDAVTCVACEGEISQSRFANNSNNPLEDLLGVNCYDRRVVMDLGQASFIDSSGICWLLACHKRFLASSGHMVLYSVPPMIDQVLRLLQLHTLLTLKADRATALAAAAEVRGKA